MDFVILEGDATVLPWERRCSKIRLLFDMCKATNKILFASGLGMQLLVHFCAVGDNVY